MLYGSLGNPTTKEVLSRANMIGTAVLVSILEIQESKKTPATPFHRDSGKEFLLESYFIEF